MQDEERINPGHHTVRSMLRIVGPVILGLGILLVVAGAIDIFTDPFHGFPFAFLIFAGMPMMFVGGVMTNMAFMGAFMRYAAGETAPVGKDTFNYMAHETRDGVRDISSAIREGFTGEVSNDDQIRCSSCQHLNDADAQFCDQCGYRLITTHVCRHCDNENDADAKFCDNCGKSMV